MFHIYTDIGAIMVQPIIGVIGQIGTKHGTLNDHAWNIKYFYQQD